MAGYEMRKLQELAKKEMKNYANESKENLKFGNKTRGKKKLFK